MELLDKRRHENDARARKLFLSKDGSAALKMIAKPFGEISHTLDSIFDSDEIEKLADYLGRIREAFSGD